jgi:putative flippase GtrA
MAAGAGFAHPPSAEPPAAAGGGGRRLPDELGSFVVVGLACTAAYALLYTLLRGLMTDLEANAAALLLTMAANFEANRRFTFHAGQASRVQQIAGYVAAYAVGLGASSLVLVALLDLLGHPGGLENTGAALTSGLAATAVRFVLMRRWVFGPRATGSGEPRSRLVRP